MFELWPYSLIFFFMAFISYLIIWYGKKTGKVFVGLIYPPFDKKTMPQHYETRITLLYIGIIFMIIMGILFLSIDAPHLSSEPELTKAEFEEAMIGTWVKSWGWFDYDLEITFNSDHTCNALYEEESYTGTWEIESSINVKFNWDTPLKIPNRTFDEDMELVTTNSTLTHATYWHSKEQLNVGLGAMFKQS